MGSLSTDLESFGYDTEYSNSTMVHNMTSVTLPNGQMNSYGSRGQPLERLRRVSFLEHSPLGYVASRTDLAGLTTTFSYSGEYPIVTSGTASFGLGTTTITVSDSGSNAEPGQ